MLVFPNTFEYFFIAYEAIRLRWDPARLGLRLWIGIAALLWVVVKLPQEWWIHVAQLDVTDTMAAHSWVLPTLVVLGAVVAAVLWVVARPRLPARDHAWRTAADPLPEHIDEAAERAQWVAAHGRLWSTGTLEKVVLMGLLWVIYAQVLPGSTASPAETFLGVAAFVLVNAALSLAVARRNRNLESALTAFGARVAVNVCLLLLGAWLIGGGLNLVNGAFFVLLLSLITVLDDRYRPVHEACLPPVRTETA